MLKLFEFLFDSYGIPQIKWDFSNSFGDSYDVNDVMIQVSFRLAHIIIIHITLTFLRSIWKSIDPLEVLGNHRIHLNCQWFSKDSLQYLLLHRRGNGRRWGTTCAAVVAHEYRRRRWTPNTRCSWWSWSGNERYQIGCQGNPEWDLRLAVLAVVPLPHNPENFYPDRYHPPSIHIIINLIYFDFIFKITTYNEDMNLWKFQFIWFLFINSSIVFLGF